MRALVPLIPLLVCAAPCAAQIGVSGARDLNFGFVSAGLTTIVPPTDPVKSGQWNITAPVGTRVRLRLTLPSVLNGPGTATMPLEFQNGDSYLQEICTGCNPDYFNPQGNKNFQFQSGAQAILRLGGRVSPALGQAPGAYGNTVILTVTVL